MVAANAEPRSRPPSEMNGAESTLTRKAGGRRWQSFRTGHIYPLLGQPTEFRIFKTSDLEKLPVHSDLIAVQIPDGFPPYVSDSDLLVINQSEQPSIRRGVPLTRAFALREDGIYVIAKQARLKLRQLRWDKVGESLVVLLPGSKSKREMIVTDKTLDFQVIGRVVWRGGPSI